MSSETREFRPFASDQRLARALDGVVLRFGDLECSAGGNVLIEDRTFSHRPCSLEWADEGGMEEFKTCLSEGSSGSGFKPSELSLVVVARAWFLKRHEVAFSQSLADLADLERVISISADENGARRAPFNADTHGATVEVYIALSQMLAPRPLQAWRKATWLSKTTFRVRCEADNVLFRPGPLDEEERRRLGLRSETVFFVEFDSGGDLTADLSDTEVPTLWVDDELLTALDQHRASPGASLLQRQMALHLITSVIFEFARESAEQDPPTYEEIAGSLVGRVARMIAGSRAEPAQMTDVLDRMRTDPRTVAAWAENTVGLRSSAMESLVANR